MKFNHKNSLITNQQLKKISIKKELNNLKEASKLKYENDRASINLPLDKILLKNINKIIKEKKKLNPSYLIVIGIGGSNLGTIAVQESVLGKNYNSLTKKTKILYLDTVDSDSLNSIIKIIQPELKKGKNIIVNAVSKSGGTTETIANFEIILNLLKKHKKNYKDLVVVTTDKNSNFWNYAVNNSFTSLEIPKKVGGRYSVFSPVGLFPLGMLNINLNRLLDGAKSARNSGLSTNKNLPALSAIIQFLNYKKGKNISDLFLFSNDLESIGKWYRQLMGESIGKEFNNQNKKIFNGITPSVSIGSTDLHSMAQLYLGGPYDKFTTILRLENSIKIKVPKLNYELVNNIETKSLHEIMGAIIDGIEIAFRKGKRPFVEITLKDKSEYSIGYFLQFKMIEMMYLGYLMNVNPFDQPSVESYKIETKKILDK